MIKWWIYGFWVFLLQLWQYLRAWNWPRPGLPSTFPTFWLPMSVTSWLFSSYLRFTVLFQREQVKDLINSQFGLEIIKEFFYCITKNTCILNINFCLFEVLVKWPTRRGIRLGHLVLWHVLVLHHKARVDDSSLFIASIITEHKRDQTYMYEMHRKPYYSSVNHSLDIEPPVSIYISH